MSGQAKGGIGERVASLEQRLNIMAAMWKKTEQDMYHDGSGAHPSQVLQQELQYIRR